MYQLLQIIFKSSLKKFEESNIFSRFYTDIANFLVQTNETASLHLVYTISFYLLFGIFKLAALFGQLFIFPFGDYGAGNLYYAYYYDLKIALSEECETVFFCICTK